MQSNACAIHVAIIMDGNGRWAERRGLPRSAGHRAGVETVRRLSEAAAGLGIGTLTLFAFSADNWRRPAAEVDHLMRMFRRYLRAETARLVAEGVRLTVIGRRDRLGPGLARAIAGAESETAAGRHLHLRLAVDYSARRAIAEAAAQWTPPLGPSIERFGERLAHTLDGAPAAAQVDLLIRTGGEKRLSDFLLWECAYAELWFTDAMWPDFTTAELAAAIADFRRRERRFGGVGAAPLVAAGGSDD